MEQIPDAPWIRDAEQNGIPGPEYPECPVCGCECRTFVFDKWATIVGCNICTEERDAEEWVEEHRDDDRPDWLDQ